MQIIFNFETWVATLPPVKSPLPKKNLYAGSRSQLTAVSYLPTPSAAGRPGLPAYRAASERRCASVPTVRVRRRAHRQTVRVRDTEDLHGISGTAGVDERSDEVSTEPREMALKRDLCSAPDQSWLSDLRSTVIRDSVLHLFSGSWLITRERRIDYELEKTFHFTSTWVKSKPPNWNFNRAPSAFTRSTCVWVSGATCLLLMCECGPVYGKVDYFLNSWLV